MIVVESSYMKRDESLTDEVLLGTFLELLANMLMQLALGDARMGGIMGREATLAISMLIMTEELT